MEEGRSDFKILTGNPTGKKPLGRPRRRWKDNIKMDLKEIYINTRNWVDSAQDRCYWRALVNAALNLRVPLAMELVEFDLFRRLRRGREEEVYCNSILFENDVIKWRLRVEHIPI